MAPRSPPITVAAAMVTKATGREMRAPWTIRARISRPTLVGPQPVLGGGRFQTEGRALLNDQGFVIKQEVGKHGQEDNQGQNHQSQDCHFVFRRRLQMAATWDFLRFFSFVMPSPLCCLVLRADTGVQEGIQDVDAQIDT